MKWLRRENAPTVREISASRILKGKFHFTLNFTICVKQIISHRAIARYFTIKSLICVINKMIFCIYNEHESQKKEHCESNALFSVKFAAARQEKWLRRENAPTVREISASRILKGKFHFTLNFTICVKQIISHRAIARYFTIKSLICVINKMIFCIYNEHESQKKEHCESNALFSVKFAAARQEKWLRRENAPTVREISASRILKGKFHFTLNFTICVKQIISHRAIARYFTHGTVFAVAPVGHSRFPTSRV